MRSGVVPTATADLDPGDLVQRLSLERIETDLFRADITEATLITTGDAELVIETWRAGEGVTRRTRT